MLLQYFSVSYWVTGTSHVYLPWEMGLFKASRPQREIRHSHTHQGLCFASAAPCWWDIAFPTVVSAPLFASPWLQWKRKPNKKKKMCRGRSDKQNSCSAIKGMCQLRWTCKPAFKSEVCTHKNTRYHIWTVCYCADVFFTGPRPQLVWLPTARAPLNNAH